MFVVDTDEEIEILKTLLENNILVSISVDTGQYDALTVDDIWKEINYPEPDSTNHANTIVGYRVFP